MAENPFSTHWNGDDPWPGEYPPGWSECSCPRCGRAVRAPEALLGKLLCPLCLPVCAVLLKKPDLLIAEQGQQEKGNADVV